MVLQIGEKIHPRKMHERYEIGVDEKTGKHREFEEPCHAHNIYKTDKHHLKLKNGL